MMKVHLFFRCLNFIKKYQEEHPDDEGGNTWSIQDRYRLWWEQMTYTAMMSGGSEKMKQYATQFVVVQ